MTQINPYYDYIILNDLLWAHFCSLRLHIMATNKYIEVYKSTHRYGSICVRNVETNKTYRLNITGDKIRLMKNTSNELCDTIWRHGYRLSSQSSNHILECIHTLITLLSTLLVQCTFVDRKTHSWLVK